MTGFELTVVALTILIGVAAMFLLGRVATIAAMIRSLDSRLLPLDAISQQSALAEAQAREAKEAAIRNLSDGSELRGRLASLLGSQATMADAVATLGPTLQRIYSEGLVKLGAASSESHALLRQEVTDRAERQARELTAVLDSAFRKVGDSIVQLRAETTEQLRTGQESAHKGMTELRESNDRKLAEVVTRSVESAKELNATAQKTVTTVGDRLAELKATVDRVLKDELGQIRAENATKLEEMRTTVDEKLHKTLEQRLGESFKLVSDQLEQVHRGLGEMQTLAVGVGDLRKVLTNVKTRGTWGEVQLDALLDQILTQEQYAKNVATRPSSSARVEFAIRLPGRGDDGPVWLPIDAKFPLEDYQRLVEAQERAEAVLALEAAEALESKIKAEARVIRDKYVEPPFTTDFGIMYLPTEGLYAEVLRRPGLTDWLQRECRIILTGPTTLAALLNSLQMGFRTLAIEKRSSEVWKILGEIKAEFAQFGAALAHTKKKLEEATNSMERTETRNRVLTRKLKGVEDIPAPGAAQLISEVAGVQLPSIAIVDTTDDSDLDGP